MSKALRRMFFHWKRHVLRALRASREDSLVNADVEYLLLYEQIVEECGKQKDRPHTQRILELIEPWADLGALARTDKQLLRDLLRTCRKIETDFHWRHHYDYRRSRFGRIVALPAIGLVVAGILLVIRQRETRWDTMLATGGSLWSRLLKALSDPISLSLFTLIIVLLGILAMRFRPS